ncbi:cupredoxin domain-containing protein [Candidatus Chloroploca sp. M-50]|uniref:Cupredoxin domain-containing protein n=1 Tax=Candidatus Chloroploca mongolica TaxID=2528176 RepID=A0ABS4DG05_9CHLR|nr:cupredoxin domain-containing protein [Candidatus Chloroploca mongolica]MBP1468368.1 cupredoxin domain-containing protein [Candidatus Chloroploca mongolica]
MFRVSVNRFRLVVIGLLLLIVLAGCGQALPPERLIELTVTSSGYEPAEIEAYVGEIVSIRFRNRDTIAHALMVELPTGTRIVAAEVGVDAIMTFPINQAGRFRFACSVPGHPEEGVLVVRPAP